MTQKQHTAGQATLRQLISDNPDWLRPLAESLVQQILEVEMDDCVGASKRERTADRSGYRSGHYRRTLLTRVGKLELAMPQDRARRFRTEVFERYQRSEKAIFIALAEMYVQGVSTRNVRAITEELCGPEFSSATVSRATQSLDEELEKFARRRLDEPYAYLILDARHEKVREDGVTRSQAVLVALGVDAAGRRNVLAVDLARRESATSWKDFLLDLQGRGLHGVEFVVSDQHAGLRQAVREVLPGAVWQSCYVHFLRNALDHLPRKANDDCLTELRWLCDRHDVAEARRNLTAWLAKWGQKHAKRCAWVEETIEETFSFYQLPREHHKHLKSTNMLERLNQELKRRTLVVSIFPNTAACLRLTRALAVEMHEEWIEATRYLNMALLADQKRQRLRPHGEAA